MNQSRPVALSIAGSDSGGGAGLQADLRVFSRIGVFGTTVVTAVTSQNLSAVSSIHPIPVDHVASQIRAVLSGFQVQAVKTGMLWSAAVIDVVADLLPATLPLVVDPVMVATSGSRLIHEDGLTAYRKRLLPEATVITPNVDEISLLVGSDINNEEDLERAAHDVSAEYHCGVLAKGGHLAGDPIDLFVYRKEVHRWRHSRVEGVTSHGSGCMLSAAIAAHLAQGKEVVQACSDAIVLTKSMFAVPISLGGDTVLLGVETS